ncbi:hypothetical protein Q5752_006360 [Cryptotrichosporon argae]
MSGLAALAPALDSPAELFDYAAHLSGPSSRASPDVINYPPAFAQPSQLQYNMPPATTSLTSYQAPAELAIDMFSQHPSLTSSQMSSHLVHPASSTPALHSSTSAQSLSDSSASTPTPPSGGFAMTPSTAAEPSWPAVTSGLTPLFAAFPNSAQLAAPARPGPVRTVCDGSTKPMPVKRASLGSMPVASPLPMTPYSPAFPYSRTHPPPKRVYHPSPATAPSLNVDLTKLPPTAPAVVKSHHAKARGASVDKESLAKPARFKPTTEQLDVLIAAYEENKNPDTSTRERLSKQLDIRPKTLQIWFQNRRSKAREKERKSLGLMHRSLPSPDELLGMVRGGTRGMDIDALRNMMHDNDPNLVPVPVSVVAISSWTRILTPGHGLVEPDLGMSLHFNPPQIRIYVTHANDTFRLTIPVDRRAIAGVHAAGNVRSAMDSLGIRFTLASGVVQFHRWTHGDWDCHSDFTSGACTEGGDVEVTGDRDVMTPACMRIQSLLAQTFPTPASAASFAFHGGPSPYQPVYAHPVQGALGLTTGGMHLLPFSVGMAPTGPPPATAASLPTSLPVALGHGRQRSLSQPTLPAPTVFASTGNTAPSVDVATSGGGVQSVQHDWYGQTAWPSALPHGNADDSPGSTAGLGTTDHPASAAFVPPPALGAGHGSMAALPPDLSMPPAYKPFVPAFTPALPLGARAGRPAREGTSSTDLDDFDFSGLGSGMSSSSSGSQDDAGDSTAVESSASLSEGFSEPWAMAAAAASASAPLGRAGSATSSPGELDMVAGAAAAGGAVL